MSASSVCKEIINRDGIQRTFEEFLIKSLKLLIKNELYLGHYSEKQVLSGTKKKKLRNSNKFSAI